jgi:L-aminopeptidase/D-esterase-like protein
MPETENNTLTALPGIHVGHSHDLDALTGCTVILCPQGATAGVAQRGGAPGTRETDLLRPLHLVQQVQAILLTGGSAFGLDAATGVMKYLEEQGAGFDTGPVKVPIVPAAVIYDLALGRSDVRPDAAMGYRACELASSQPVRQGNVGAGTGATVGKILGMPYAMKSGLGCGTLHAGGLLVSALMVVNVLGEVLDPQTCQILAGARNPAFMENPEADVPEFVNTVEVMMQRIAQQHLSDFDYQGNTAIGVVATNARLTKEETNLVAQMGQNGLARTVRPAHTLFDGDTLFALSLGEIQADASTVGAMAAEAVAEAVVNAVRFAAPAGGLPGLGAAD